jgi:hypothetical protein
MRSWRNGRRASLRGWWPRGRVGSTPTGRTKIQRSGELGSRYSARTPKGLVRLPEVIVRPTRNAPVHGTADRSGSEPDDPKGSWRFDSSSAHHSGVTGRMAQAPAFQAGHASSILASRSTFAEGSHERQCSGLENRRTSANPACGGSSPPSSANLRGTDGTVRVIQQYLGRVSSRGRGPRSRSRAGSSTGRAPLLQSGDRGFDSFTAYHSRRGGRAVRQPPATR